MASVKLEQIFHAYGSREVLKGLDLEIPSSSFTCLLGGTGSGKTTILRIIAGLERPSAGIVRIAERLVTEGPVLRVAPEDRNLSYVFQDLALWPHFTVLKNVTWVLEVRGDKSAGEKARAILERFGLAGHEQKYPHQLSGGQQQLLAMARAMVTQPRLLLMDEPLSSLDVRLKARMMQEVKKLHDEFDVTLIYVTHDHREAFALANHVVVLNDRGGVEAAGSGEEVRASQSPFVREFLAAGI